MLRVSVFHDRSLTLKYLDVGNSDPRGISGALGASAYCFAARRFGHLKAG